MGGSRKLIRLSFGHNDDASTSDLWENTATDINLEHINFVFNALNFGKDFL